MTTSELVQSVYLKAAGKIPTFTSGSAKWLKIVAIANGYIDSWQNEPGVDWYSLYAPSYSIGTATATDTFELDDDVRKISDGREDPVRIIHTDGTNFTDYAVVPGNQLRTTYSQGAYCAQIGKTLVFNKPFASTDAQFGGTIYVPMYGYAEHIVGDNDDVPVDDPQWLVIMCAAEYVRNDIVKQNQYPNLIGEANNLMVSMKDANDAQINSVATPWRPAGADW